LAVKQILSMRDNTWSLITLWDKIIETYSQYNSVLDECALVNTKRIYYMSIISIPLRLINIYQFAVSGSYDTEAMRLWNYGIIASHAILLLFMIGFYFAASKLRNETEANTAMHLLQYAAVLVIMASGIVIVAFDQLVTTNITPFLLSCIVCATFFLLRPLVSFLIFTMSYAAFHYLIAFFTTNDQILLSSRVNGITAVGAGFFLSVLLWHYNYTNITQKWRIENRQKQLEHMAYYDHLTNLPNRRLFYKLFKKEMVSMRRYGHETVLIILDIDDFKKVNDTHGHPVGDDVLRQLADLLSNNVRDSDIVSRFGGEEFVILMTHTSIDGGYTFAERLRTIIMEKKFTVGSVTIKLTCSLGICLLNDIDSRGLEDYYFLADRALYLAKQGGKNRVETACRLVQNA
jgi:diguanylate cyclase (GGDEF)-like protein